MKPRKALTSRTVCGVGQSAMPFSLVRSICIVPWLKTTPKNSMDLFSKRHFSGLRNRSCFASLSKTQCTSFQCRDLSFSVCTRMSSMYIVSQPSSNSLAKITFIIVWKVAGELVSAKNITLGSYNPQFMMKAAFHSSPCLMRTLLYPHWMSNFENKAAPFTRLINSGISGSR